MLRRRRSGFSAQARRRRNVPDALDAPGVGLGAWRNTATWSFELRRPQQVSVVVHGAAEAYYEYYALYVDGELAVTLRSHP